MEKRRELGEFLKSRRSRVQPRDVGLESIGRRRVPGLRREELSQLAGVSFGYYVRLEQGRAVTPPKTCWRRSRGLCASTRPSGCT